MSEAAKLRFVDSHCHIDMAEFDLDRENVLARARQAGVEELLVVGQMDSEKGHLRALEVSGRFGLPVSAGVHPHEARIYNDALHQQLLDLGRRRAIVAVGEIGLDYHYDHSPRPIQGEAFRRQLSVARAVGLPVIVHARAADSETAALLEEEGAGDVGGVIHCFTGGPELARRALSLGFHLSFSGIVTFPRSEGIREVARMAPLDRILVETDAPFLAPVPHRGKRNEPAFVVEVARFVADLRGMSLEAFGVATTENFRRLFPRSQV